MTARMRGPVALIGVLGLILVAGCSTETARSDDAHVSLSCIPPAFKLFAPRPLPKALSTPLGATILSSFAIFRRPALPSDEPPTSDLVDGQLNRELSKDYELSSYFPAYVRQPTGFPGDRRYFVIPAFGRPEAVPPAHCFPVGVRRELREAVEHEHRRLTEPAYCIIEAGSGGNAPVPGCEAFAQVNESSRAFHVSDFLGGEPTIELVPDGVASVRVTYRAHPPIAVHVNENAFVLTPPAAPHTRLDAELRRLVRKLVDRHLTKVQQLRVTSQYNKAYAGTYPTKIEWLNRSGTPVRVLSSPTAESNSTTSVGDLRAPIEG